MLVNLTNLQNRTSRLRDMSRDMFRTKTMVTRHVSLNNHHSFFWSFSGSICKATLCMKIDMGMVILKTWVVNNDIWVGGLRDGASWTPGWSCQVQKEIYSQFPFFAQRLHFDISYHCLSSAPVYIDEPAFICSHVRWLKYSIILQTRTIPDRLKNERRGAGGLKSQAEPIGAFSYLLT